MKLKSWTIKETSKDEGIWGVTITVSEIDSEKQARRLISQFRDSVTKSDGQEVFKPD